MAFSSFPRQQVLLQPLLDHLAADFMQNGWSFRRLHRLIVTSKAYQLRSTNAGADAETQAAKEEALRRRVAALELVLREGRTQDGAHKTGREEAPRAYAHVLERVRGRAPKCSKEEARGPRVCGLPASEAGRAIAAATRCR